MAHSAISAPCDGKTVVVTGAASGFGQAITIAFAAAGAERIAIVDRSSALETIEKASQAAAGAGRPVPDLLPLHLEVGDPADVSTGVTKIHSKWGHVDILINTTDHMAAFELRQTCSGVSDTDMCWKTWEVSIKAPFVFSRALLPLLLEGTDKTIVNVISTSYPLLSSLRGADDLSELAMMRFSQSLMLQCGNEGLLAYSLQPGHCQSNEIEESWSMSNDIQYNGMDANGHATWLVNQVELASDALIHLTSERREWLGGKHITCTEDMRLAIERNGWDMRNSVLKLSASSDQISVPLGKRGRVPRSSY